MEVKFNDCDEIFYHICDMCEKDEGQPLVVWDSPKFVLCMGCIENLFIKYCTPRIKEQLKEKIIVNRTKISEHIRNQIYNRDGNMCIKCQSTENLVIDHIIPFSMGGNTSLNNLQTLCKSCNSKKSNRYVG